MLKNGFGMNGCGLWQGSRSSNDWNVVCEEVVSNVIRWYEVLGLLLFAIFVKVIEGNL